MGFFENFNKELHDIKTPYEVKGISVTCSHCGSTSFSSSEAQLNTAGLTFLNLDWANKTASILICDSCGKVEWFLTNPEKV